MKKILLVIGSVLLAVVLAAGIFTWNAYRKFMAVEVVQVDPQLTIWLGGGGNSVVLFSPDMSQALVVDSKMGSAAQKLRLAVPSPEVFLVNTHLHGDHIGGNTLYPTANLIAGSYSPEEWARNTGKNRYPDRVVAPGTAFTFTVGNETVEVRNLGRAHTTNDAVVYLKNRKMLITGDLVFLGRHPVLVAKSGANVASWINALDTLYNRYDVTTLVPGHGPVAGKEALRDMRDYFASLGEALGDPAKQAALRAKYKAYASLPGFSGFDKTLSFIENERRNGAK